MSVAHAVFAGTNYSVTLEGNFVTVTQNDRTVPVFVGVWERGALAEVEGYQPGREAGDYPADADAFRDAIRSALRLMVADF